jgi:hypothetical protein
VLNPEAGVPVRAVKASVLFNANTGQHTIESETPLEPLDVTIEEPTRLVTWKTNVLEIRERFESLDKLHETIQSIYFVLPTLLAVDFADPPFVDRVDGSVGPVHFGWELNDWKASFRFTTQEKQESDVALAWERLGSLSVPGRRRLVAALNYFHVACRLSRQGATPGEFLGEVLLNLAKVLEVLFPPAGAIKTLDAARLQLRTLGFSDVEIERDYIPAIALRNNIDVGHVHLGLFSSDQLAVLHGYAEDAEEPFRVLLGRVLRKVASGEYQVEPYEIRAAGRDAIDIVERIRTSAQRTQSAENSAE